MIYLFEVQSYSNNSPKYRAIGKTDGMEILVRNSKDNKDFIDYLAKLYHEFYKAKDFSLLDSKTDKFIFNMYELPKFISPIDMELDALFAMYKVAVSDNPSITHIGVGITHMNEKLSNRNLITVVRFRFTNPLFSLPYPA